MFTRLKTMLIKEFIQILRDPKMRFVILLVPLVQIIIFGYAVNTDVKHINTALYDLDNSVPSRELAARLQQSGYFNLIARVGTVGEIRDLIDHGQVKAAVQINHGFAADIQAGRTAKVQIIVDGTDPNTARIVLSHAVKIAGNFSDQLLIDREVRRRGSAWQPAELELQSRAWFNENLESRNYYVPGVMAQMVLIVTMMLSAMSVVREKEIGTMEQIIVTPIRRWEFILGKTLPFALIGYLNVTMVTTLAVFWVDIPIRGSLLLLGVATGVYLLSSLGFGLFISTVSRSQQQAMMSAFMFMFPAMLLSGFAFPVENMPESIQYLTWINPLRHYLVIIRGIFLKGVGIDVLWPQIAILAILGGSILGVAVYRFRKTVV
ncbi:MAG: ABC transporter permease [Desulfuromonas sp.]|nr:ABC transporter permease [Desulfuromonas sp.]